MDLILSFGSNFLLWLSVGLLYWLFTKVTARGSLSRSSASQPEPPPQPEPASTDEWVHPTRPVASRSFPRP